MCKNNDLESEALLFQQHFGMIVAQAIKFPYTRVTDLDDYKQAASIGLLKAIRNYDSSMGAFSSFAWPAIRNCIIHEYKKFTSEDRSLDDIDLENLAYEEPESLWQFEPSLSDNEHFVLIAKMCNLTAKEIADKLDCSQVRVKYIYRKAKEKIRNANT